MGKGVSFGGKIPNHVGMVFESEVGKYFVLFLPKKRFVILSFLGNIRSLTR